MTKTLPQHIVTRFAPSPTGELHLGHIFSACFARQWANQHYGEMRLRIDDIDHTRCRPEFTDLIYDDLSFLGLNFEGDVLIQSQRHQRYQDALNYLEAQNFIYPCFLTRRELNELLSAPHGGDQIIRNTDQHSAKDKDQSPAWRLRMDNICKEVTSLSYQEWGDGTSCQNIPVDLHQLDDIVIARKDIGTSYHLSVVLDDNDSGVSVVTRGDDLKESTPVHRLLQVILGLQETVWAHHELITDDEGNRLAKRDSSKSIQSFRKEQMTKEDIMALIPRI